LEVAPLFLFSRTWAPPPPPSPISDRHLLHVCTFLQTLSFFSPPGLQMPRLTKAICALSFWSFLACTLLPFTLPLSDTFPLFWPLRHSLLCRFPPGVLNFSRPLYARILGFDRSQEERFSTLFSFPTRFSPNQVHHWSGFPSHAPPCGGRRDQKGFPPPSKFMKIFCCLTCFTTPCFVSKTSCDLCCLRGPFCPFVLVGGLGSRPAPKNTPYFSYGLF